MMGLPASIGMPRPLGAGASDPYWAYVTSLLHFDGTDGSTTIIDSALYSAGWSSIGGAAISTASPKFGSGALSLNGSSQAISHNVDGGDARFGFGADDFTLEMWVKPNAAITTRQTLFVRWLTNGVVLHITDAAKLRGFVTINGVTTECTGTTSITPGAYHHVAMVRDGGTLRIYLNGAQEAAAALSGTINTIGTSAYIGMEATFIRYFNGLIDEFRVTKGVCRYPGGASFTPPTAPFPNS